MNFRHGQIRYIYLQCLKTWTTKRIYKVHVPYRRFLYVLIKVVFKCFYSLLTIIINKQRYLTVVKVSYFHNYTVLLINMYQKTCSILYKAKTIFVFMNYKLYDIYGRFFFNENNSLLFERNPLFYDNKILTKRRK